MYKDGRKKATLGHFKVGDSLVIPLTMLKDSDDSENMVPTPPKRGVTRLGNEAAGKTVPLTNQDLPQDSTADKSIEVLRQLRTDISTSTHEEQTSLLEDDEEFMFDLDEDDITRLRAAIFEANETARYVLDYFISNSS